jgi:hypothetical protein
LNSWPSTLVELFHLIPCSTAKWNPCSLPAKISTQNPADFITFRFYEGT